MSNVSSSNGQGVVAPKLRFSGFSEDWELVRIGDVYAERSERGAENMDLLSVTMTDGVKMRSDIEGKDNSSEDKSNYKIVYTGDMVYNSMRMWQGASGISPYDGIVSPAYTILKPRIPISNGFFAALFKNERLINAFRKNSQGMTSDTWNLKYPQIETIKIHIPTVSEQEKIAEFIALIDAKISKQRILVDSLKKYKRGVSNVIFSEADNWEKAPFLEIFSTVSDKPYQVTTSEYYDSGLYEVVDQGKNDIVGYNSDESKVFNSVPIIVYGDHTTIIKYRNTPFIVGGDGIKLLTTHTQNDLQYLYYALCQYNIQPEGYKRHFSIVKSLYIPLPSVEQQHIIAQTLATIDLKIHKEADILEQLLLQKKALLQQLFI